MTREEFYSKDRGERAMYINADIDALVGTPLTRDGFEALAERITKENDLILDDLVRETLMGYIHHVQADEIMLSIRTLCKIVYKRISNNLTYLIIQEAKQRDIAEKLKQQESDNKVVPIKKEEAPPASS